MNDIIAPLAAALLFAAMATNPVQAADAAIAARAEAAQGKGTVVKVDAAAGVVNMNHEAIPPLKWPAMTMDFKVVDKKLLTGLKPGQKVGFGLVKDPALGYVIARIEISK